MNDVEIEEEVVVDEDPADDGAEGMQQEDEEEVEADGEETEAEEEEEYMSE